MLTERDLKDEYKAKRQQEQILYGMDVDTLVLRPKVLSYGHIPFNTIFTTRKDLAREIIEWVDGQRPETQV